MFSTQTSALRSRSFTSSSPRGDFRLTVIDFLLALNMLEVIRIVIRLALAQPPARIANAGVLDLHHLGAEPGERLGAGRSRFELGEIDDADTGEKLQVYADVLHGIVSPVVWHCRQVGTGQSSVASREPDSVARLPQIVAPPRDADCRHRDQAGHRHDLHGQQGAEPVGQHADQQYAQRAECRCTPSAAPSAASGYAVAHAARSARSACWQTPPSRRRR